MENKLDIKTVHTVQIDGVDVEVVSTSDLDKAFGSYEESVTKKVTDTHKETETSVKRDLSKKLGINVFDDGEIEKFIKGEDKVARSEYDLLNKKLEELSPIKDEYSKLQKENNTLKLDNAIITNDVDEKYKDKVIKLAEIEQMSNKELTPAQAVEKIVTEFDMFKSRTPRVGRGFGGGPEGKTDSEKYINDKYKDNPYYKK